MTELTIAQSNPVGPTSRAGKIRAQYYVEIQAKRTHTCLTCKKEYVSKRRHLNEGIKFCSRECRACNGAKGSKPLGQLIMVGFGDAA